MCLAGVGGPYSAHPDFLSSILTLEQITEWHVFLSERGDPFIRNQVWATGNQVKEQWVFMDEETKRILTEAKKQEAELQAKYG